MPTRWYIEDCAFPEECTDENFRKWRVESYESEEKCREAFLKHLTGSGLHWHHKKEESQIFVDGANVETEEVTEEAIDAYWAEVEKAKRSQESKRGTRGVPNNREGAARAASDRKRGRPTSAEDDSPQHDVDAAARKAAKYAIQEAIESGAVARPSSSVVGAHPSSSRQPHRRLAIHNTDGHLRSEITQPLDDDDSVVVSRVVLQRVIAHMERACDATRHGYQIADAARLAFGEETTRIENCIDAVKQALRR